MRGVIIVVVFCGTLSCTKQNPDLCCNDAADCAAAGLTTASTCAEGLVCRGNQCIAETCSTSTDCDAAAAFCDSSTGTCVEQCTEDTQCPGFGGGSNDPFCIAGGCVQCRMGMDDCSGTTPICDANACRGCQMNSDCASELCDTTSGACIDPSTLIYATPGGADTAACTEADPCSITHAVASVTPSLNTILMGSGTYAAAVTINSGATMTILGNGAIFTASLSVSHGSKVSVENATFSALLECVDTSLPDSELTFTSASVGAMNMAYCNATFEQSVTTGETGMALNASLTADRSNLDIIDVDETPVIGSISIINSIFSSIGMPNTGSGNNFSASVSFSSTYAIGCVNDVAGVSAHYSNVVACDDLSSVYTVSGDDTCFDHVIAYPEMNPPNGVPVGVIAEDPKAVNCAGGDFHLTAGSPAIDTAVTSTPDPVDYDGVTRPQGSGYDIGAFEFH
jgi:hypothetical protein